MFKIADELPLILPSFQLPGYLGSFKTQSSWGNSAEARVNDFSAFRRVSSGLMEAIIRV
jgi:hypothetical protein